MSIERSITPYISFSEDPLLTALGKINANRSRTTRTRQPQNNSVARANINQNIVFF